MFTILTAAEREGTPRQTYSDCGIFPDLAFAGLIEGTTDYFTADAESDVTLTEYSTDFASPGSWLGWWSASMALLSHEISHLYLT